MSSDCRSTHPDGCTQGHGAEANWSICSGDSNGRPNAAPGFWHEHIYSSSPMGRSDPTPWEPEA